MAAPARQLGGARPPCTPLVEPCALVVWHAAWKGSRRGRHCTPLPHREAGAREDGGGQPACPPQRPKGKHHKFFFS